LIKALVKDFHIGGKSSFLLIDCKVQQKKSDKKYRLNCCFVKYYLADA